MFRQLRALPNQLTLLRLTIVPFLVLAILDARYHVAFILIVIAGVSDGLDGALARIFRQRTQLGSYLDPIADKLMLSTLFLVLMHVELVPQRVTVMVFSRDFGILVVATLLYVTIGARDFRPSVVGKANTIAQIFAVCSVVLAQTDPDAWVLWIRHTSLEATLWLTVGSGFHYLWRCGQRLSSPASSQSTPGPSRQPLGPQSLQPLERPRFEPASAEEAAVPVKFAGSGIHKQSGLISRRRRGSTGNP